MQVEHKTEKGTIQFRLIPNDGNLFTTGISAKNTIPEGFQFIGLTSEITEEQCGVMLPGISTAQLDGVYYSIGDGERYCHESALDSFKSLMQHLQVYEVNPLSFDPTGITTSEWKEAQSRTGKWIVLFKTSE